MTKTIAFFVRLALCGGILIAASSGFVVRAQRLSLPAEINKSFTPIAIQSGQVSRLMVSVYNPNSFPLRNASWTDNLIGVQPGLLIADRPRVANSCGGNVTAVPGTTTLSLSGGTVPAQVGNNPGECIVGIDVASSALGTLINTIPANALHSDGDSVPITNTTPASATLTIVGTASPAVTKAFSPNTVFVGETSVLTIKIDNTDPSISLTQTSLTDRLPPGVVIADPASPADALQNCGASASLVANPGGNSITLNGATVAPNLDCILKVNVTASDTGVFTNTIPAKALTTKEGLTNLSPTSAALNVQALKVEKAFLPVSFQAGGTTTLTVTLQNPTGTAYTGVSISDTLPGTVLTIVDGSAATTCGGSVTTTPPRTVTLTGGTIPPSATPPSPPGTCTITVQVTAPADASTETFTNTIPANTLRADKPGVTNVTPASADVKVYAVGTGISGEKSFSPSTIGPGENSRLRISIRAPADTQLTNFSLTDKLPPGVTISNSTSPFVSPGCGPSATLTAVTGSDTITLTNATIDAGALCAIEVWVTSSTEGTVTNIIPPSNIKNDQNRVPASDLKADLTVKLLADFTMSKAFSPKTVGANGISTLTITLMNRNTSPLVDVSLTDDLPGTNPNDSVVVAPTPNASTTCGSGVVSAIPGSRTIQLTGGTIPAQVGSVPGRCTVSVDVQGSAHPGNRRNTIPATNVSGRIDGTGNTINPAEDASAILAVEGLAILVVKGFDPLTVFGGSASTMSVQLINPTGAPVTDVSFTDNMPTGMFLANPVNFDVGTCGGALSGKPGADSFSFSGGSLLANATCTLTLSVTTNVSGNLTNTIPANAVTTAEGVSNLDPAEATLTNLAGVSISKYFSPQQIDPGDTSTLTITIKNTGNIPLSGLGFRDTLLPGVTLGGPPGPTPTNTCGGKLLAESGTQDIRLSDGALSANSSCSITVAITGSTVGTYKNTIPPGALTNNEDTTNTQEATDTLTVGTPTPEEKGGGGGGGSGKKVLIPLTGFAPGRVTDLNGLPVTRYNALNDVMLEIPVLNLKLSVAGIPMKDKTWDVNWLLNQAGWLEGSAFPGFSGNSVLTSHVTLAYGQPGPFASLHKLRAGDKIFVHSFGELFVYEIRSIQNLNPADPAILQHEEKPWLTLVTCANFDERTETYLDRLTVKAELVYTQPEPWWSAGP